jgi:hypothetical protein
MDGLNEKIELAYQSKYQYLEGWRRKGTWDLGKWFIKSGEIEGIELVW